MKRVKFWSVLLAALCMCLAFSLVGCGGDTADLDKRLSQAEQQAEDLRATIFSLSSLVQTQSATINELKQLIQSSGSGNEALKAKLDELTASLEQAQRDLSEAQSKLALLTIKVDGADTKTYSLGESVTLVSNGLKIYTVTPYEFYTLDGTSFIRYKLKLYVNLPINITSILNANLYCANDNTLVTNHTNIRSNELDSVFGFYSSLTLGSRILYITCNGVAFAQFSFSKTN